MEGTSSDFYNTVASVNAQKSSTVLERIAADARHLVPDNHFPDTVNVSFPGYIIFRSIVGHITRAGNSQYAVFIRPSEIFTAGVVIGISGKRLRQNHTAYHNNAEKHVNNSFFHIFRPFAERLCNQVCFCKTKLTKIFFGIICAIIIHLS